MKKYYYTDPLAAAYMEREFDVKLLSTRGVNLLYRDGATFSTVNCPDGIYMGEYYYVADESLGVYEPRIGDVVRYWITREPDYFAQSTAKRTKEYIKRVTKSVLFQIGHGKIERLQIIQRIGKPFFMPEVE